MEFRLLLSKGLFAAATPVPQLSWLRIETREVSQKAFDPERRE